jgi:dTDP-4-amino-4,6-dideoxygalactose transaminase
MNAGSTARAPQGKARLVALLESYRQKEAVMVTRPTMPPLADYTRELEGIWQRRWLTNDGDLHRRLESELARHLGVEHLSLFCNGATALLVMLQALGIEDGEVITTPFTFPATTHVLHWNRVKPVFCDIEPETYNIDPAGVERLLGPDTRAILAVHVYGNPCRVEELQRIAERHGLLLAYDAAHAFGVTLEGRPVLAYGDMSMLSFHATKVFSTIEGGAIVSRTEMQRQRVNSLKNFGIAGEESIIGPGINGKMNEFQAAFGLLQLKTVDAEIERRKAVAETYRTALSGVAGIRFLEDRPGVRHNYGYFPITVDARSYGLSRDELYLRLRDFNIFTRKYFHPLVSHAPCYAGLPSACPDLLPIAERVAREVLCLPIYATLALETAGAIAQLIRDLPGCGP